MSSSESFQGTSPDFRREESRDRCPFQAERSIERAVGISKVMHVSQPISSQESLSLLPTAHVNERQLRSLSVQLLTQLRQIGSRLATKGSAKVSQEHHEYRSRCR